MSERYSKLYSLPENLYAEGAPVVVSAGNLLKDNQTGKVLAQLKIKNISNKTIKAAKVLVHALDTIGKAIDGDAEQEYLDLSVEQGEEFGQKAAVTLPNASTRGFSIEVKQVVFTDNSTWEATGKAWEPLPVGESLIHWLGDIELVKQYQLHFGGKCESVPQEHKDLWCCTCGEWNKENECYCCGKGKAEQIAFDLEALRVEKDARLAKEKAEREEKEKIEHEKAKRTKKTLLTVIPSAVVLVLAVFLIVKVLIPNNTYNKARTLLESGKYDEAIALFSSLDGYKDSAESKAKAEKLAEEARIEAENYSQYDIAKSLLLEGEYLEAISAFSKLGNYRDSSQFMQDALDIAFQAAETLVEEGQCDEAIALYQGLMQFYSTASGGKYNELTNGCAYAEAKKMYLCGNYTSAYQGYKALVGYKDVDKLLSTDQFLIQAHENLVIPFRTVGKTVVFGSYEQDNDKSNGTEPIEWIVLDVTEGKCLLLSKINLDREAHSYASGNPTDAFYKGAFSEAERAAILSTNVEYEYNDEIGSTNSYVFALSVDQVEQYLPNSKDRVCATSKYAASLSANKYQHAFGTATEIKYRSGDDVSWWLGSPFGHYRAYYVNDEGNICTTQERDKSLFIRPAMWVDLSIIEKLL